MATKMVYDPSQQKWVPTTDSSNSGVVSSPPVTTPSGTVSTDTGKTPQSAASSQTQTNSAGKANKEQSVLEYNTLEGDVTLKASVGVLKVKENTTVDIEGVGDYLSGLYYVSGVTYSLDSSSGFGMTCTVVKTGFGDSLKSGNTSTPQAGVREEPIEVKSDTTIKVGDSVRIVGDDAVYSNASQGVKVPNWVKQKTLTVQQLSSDGTRALLQPIFSWTYLKYIQKV